MDILHAIGNTSMVRLREVVPPGGADILVKLEWENPTGSIKDRMAHAVISRAEEDGRLKPGDTVVEYTGGSTGASLALVCAAKGYPLQIVSSDVAGSPDSEILRMSPPSRQVLCADIGFWRYGPDSRPTPGEHLPFDQSAAHEVVTAACLLAIKGLHPVRKAYGGFLGRSIRVHRAGLRLQFAGMHGRHTHTLPPQFVIQAGGQHVLRALGDLIGVDAPKLSRHCTAYRSPSGSQVDNQGAPGPAQERQGRTRAAECARTVHSKQALEIFRDRVREPAQLLDIAGVVDEHIESLRVPLQDAGYPMLYPGADHIADNRMACRSEVRMEPGGHVRIPNKRKHGPSTTEILVQQRPSEPSARARD